MLKSLTSLPATIWLLGLVSFFNDSASELVYPLVPLYLASVLMAGPKALGLIEGIAEATASLLKLFAGVMADRLHATKSWVVGGYCLAALARPLLALAGSWPVVLALRFADRVGKGLRTSPRDALLALSVGLSGAAWRSACTAPWTTPARWWGLCLLPGCWRGACRSATFWGARDPGLITVGLAFGSRAPARGGARRQAFSWTLQGFPSASSAICWCWRCFTLGNSSNMFLLLRARDMGLPEDQVPLLWALVSATAMSVLDAAGGAVRPHRAAPGSSLPAGGCMARSICCSA